MTNYQVSMLTLLKQLMVMTVQLFKTQPLRK